MTVLAPTIEHLAQLGANIEISKDARLLAPTIEKIVSIAAANGGHVTIDASNLLAPTLEKLAQIGRHNITIRV